MRQAPKDWKYSSRQNPGFYEVVTPHNSACRAVWFFRLNLQKDARYTLRKPDLELSAAVIAGRVAIATGDVEETLQKLDSFYLPGGQEIEIAAQEDAILYIGGAVYEGIGEFFTRRYDPSLPLGEIHQVHGEPPYRRDVFMTLNQEVPASRLITGFTWGDDGKWTSWPPHQHEDDLEEVYCYFDIPAPKFALHVGYTEPGVVAAVHPVSSGDCVAIPRGYHPTVAMPCVKSSYFWVMAAHSVESRSYERSVPDPRLAG